VGILAAQLAHPGYLYERVRKLRGWFPNDSGSYPSDGLDMLMTDTPLMSGYQYIDNPAFDYPDARFVTPTPIDYLQSYRYIYVEEGNALELMHVAIDQGCGLVFCMYWPQAFFNPINGMLPEGVKWTPDDGGHALSGWSMFPGVVGAQNHWTAAWNTDAAKLGSGFRAGDVGIPFSFFRAGQNSPIFQVIAVSPEPVVPDPLPPAPRPVITYGRYKAVPAKLVVFADNTDEGSVLTLDNGRSVKQVEEGVFVVKQLGMESGRHSAFVVNSDGQRSEPFTFTV